MDIHVTNKTDNSNDHKPRVDERLERKRPLHSRTMNDDFPTAASPANTTL